MSLKKDLRIMQIKDIIFYHDKGDAPRYVFDATGIQGWDDGAGADREASKRPTSHGDFPSPATLTSKLITITGFAMADTVPQLHLMRDAFMALFSDGEYVPVGLSTASSTRYMDLSLGGTPSWIQKTDTLAAWKLDLYAPDPFMYSAILSGQLYSAKAQPGGLRFPMSYPVNFGAGTEYRNVTLTNFGNVPAWPVYTVRGEYQSGFTLRSPLGREITYRGIVSHSAPVTIDTAKGSALVDGVDRSYELGKREWFAIPPYSAITPRFIPNNESDGWVDVTYRSTWI